MIVDPSIPQPQPLPAMGVRSSSDIVDHLDRVLKSQPPEVQAAVDHAHGIMGMNPPSGVATAAPESSAAPSLPASAPVDTPPSINSSGPDPALITGPSLSMSSSDAQPLPRPVATAPPNPHMENLERMTKEGPGANKIHNPFLRGLAHVGDAIGSGIFPEFTSFIPGFTAHHDRLIGEEENQLGNEQKAAKSTADVAHTESQSGLENAQAGAIPSETELRNAQTEEAKARTDQIKNPVKALSPKDKYIAVGDGVFNAEAGDWAKAPTDKKLAEITEVTQKVGDALGVVPNKDGKYLIPSASVGELLKPKPEKTVSPEQQFLDEYKVKNPGSSIAEAEKAFKQLVPKEGPDHGASFVDPQTHKLVRVEPGQAVPEGAMSPAQTGAQNAPTTQQRNVAAQAGLVHEQTPMMLSEIERLKDKLGPVSGRWNEFMQGKVGTDNPDMAGLRADLLMYSSAVALMHARGRLPENLREEFDHAINAPKQTAGNLTAVIKKIDQWATKNPGVVSHVGSGVHGPSSGGDVTLDQINAEVSRRKAAQGKK